VASALPDSGVIIPRRLTMSSALDLGECGFILTGVSSMISAETSRRFSSSVLLMWWKKIKINDRVSLSALVLSFYTTRDIIMKML